MLRGLQHKSEQYRRNCYFSALWKWECRIKTLYTCSRSLALPTPSMCKQDARKLVRLSIFWGFPILIYTCLNKCYFNRHWIIRNTPQHSTAHVLAKVAVTWPFTMTACQLKWWGYIYEILSLSLSYTPGNYIIIPLLLSPLLTSHLVKQIKPL